MPSLSWPKLSSERIHCFQRERKQRTQEEREREGGPLLTKAAPDEETSTFLHVVSFSSYDALFSSINYYTPFVTLHLLLLFLLSPVHLSSVQETHLSGLFSLFLEVSGGVLESLRAGSCVWLSGFLSFLDFMGFISRKILPACGNMCVCCPALRPSSRRPVKRYKKLLADIFPKAPDGPANERKIMKLCEYAAKNPFRIPKIVKFLEQRCYKELRSGHISFITIISESYSKLLYVCKAQMAYFAASLLNVMFELLESKQQDTIQILGCQTLTRFIYSQGDNTYAHNIEGLVHKVCVLTCQQHGEHKNLLRAASLQCLSAMVWYMEEYSYIFADFDEIIHAILENYGMGEHINNVDERSGPHHNWVDEVVRSEARVGATVGTNISKMTIRSWPETRDFSALTREQRESPLAWSQICIQKLAELAKESSTMRRILDPMFMYFDTGRHWAPRNGLALHVLVDISYLVKNSGFKQLILAMVVRHLDHKNVSHDPQTKSEIVHVVTSLAQQLRSQALAADIGVLSDLCRHLRKSLQVTVSSIGGQESNWNLSLQNSIQDCLLEIAKGVGDARPLFDMMSITMEKLATVTIVARATIESLLILAHIFSMASSHLHRQLVFPESLLVQTIRIMMHPDAETRIVAHQIFSVILVRTLSYASHELQCLYEPRKWQSETTSAFASATALLEKLRREKEGLNADKLGNDACDDNNFKDVGEEELRHGRARKGSPYTYKLSSIIDRTATTTSYDEVEANIILLNEDQTSQLLSAFWVQANQPDNLPSNFEAIAHSFSLTLLSSRIKNSNHSNTACFFQLPLSLLSASLDPNGILPPCQRSLFTLAIGMLAIAGKLYHIHELTDMLKLLIAYDVDPYLKIGRDWQVCIKPLSDLKKYGSEGDQQAAASALVVLRNAVAELHWKMFDIIVQNLCILTSLKKDDIAKQLSETFTPEYGPTFGPKPALDWVSIESLALSEESSPSDEERSRSSSIDADTISEYPAANLPRFISGSPSLPSLPHIISVGQLLDSALHVAGQVAGTSVSASTLPYGTMVSQCEAFGMGMRKKLSTWLVAGHDSISGCSVPELQVAGCSMIWKVDACGSGQDSLLASEPLRPLRLPPASPFDNFMKAAGC